MSQGDFNRQPLSVLQLVVAAENMPLPARDDALGKQPTLGGTVAGISASVFAK